MVNVKVFADRQTEGQAKNQMPPIFRYRGIKMTGLSMNLTTYNKEQPNKFQIINTNIP
jgi:hypothetical protein